MTDSVALPPIPHNGSTNQEAEQLTKIEKVEDYQSISTKLKALINDWEHFREKAKENRKTRDVEFSTETLRREGTLDEDETMIPVRIIDTNIQREQPPYINYLKNSRRLCIFTSLSNPDIDTDQLELEFTRGMTYQDWEKAHFKAIDGSATHGWDSVEVVYDTTKPFNVGIEHVGFDHLYWPRTTKDIQQAPRVIRAYDYSLIELQKFVESFGWSATEVNKIINARKQGKKEGETTRVHKVMYKEEGVVMVAWFCTEEGVADWLKAPTPLYLGIDKETQSVDPVTQQPVTKWEPVPQKEYPYFILPYRESEKPKLVERHGRVFLDAPKQEAQTGVLSSFVNGVQRATKILASPAQDDGSGNSVKEIADSPLEGGTILNKPFNFFSPPYPDFEILKALQYMDTSNSQETNQTNFAVMNRQDSRKTAKEMSLAEQQSNLLNSVQLTLFSSYIRGIYSLCWLIVQSQAQQNLITFLLVNKPQPVINPLTRQPIVQNGQPLMRPNWVNNLEVISAKYEVRAAGDVDVIQRSELLQQMKQDWAVIQKTALATQFLADLVRLSYPTKGEQYAKIIMDGDANQIHQLQEQLQQMAGVVSGFTVLCQELVKQHDVTIQSLTPEDQAKLGQLMMAGDKIKQTVEQQQKKASGH